MKERKREKEITGKVREGTNKENKEKEKGT